MIRLYDTMAREKREFRPIDEQRITMYVCGPTVYGRAHIGNARPAVVFDTLARLIRHQFGADSLVYARNVTDVDDKIIASAAEEGVEPAVITKRYEDFYLADMRALGVVDPDIAPHATDEIAPMVAMIGELVAKGHAYAAEGHVLFSVASDKDYGALSRRDRDAMIAGARVEVAPYKRDPADFVLWKPSDVGVIGWDSPWGRGRPGWHIECSAMIRAHLGETIDIHGGGLDLIFPHHENEIAQSRCAHGGAPLANYWVHNGFVDMGAEKMSKSLGNVALVNELQEKFVGGALRLALLSAQYRQPLAWTTDVTEWARLTFEKWCGLISDALEEVRNIDPSELELPQPNPEIVAALSDDLNTPKALSVIHRSATALHRVIARGQKDDFEAYGLQFLADTGLLGLKPSFGESSACRFVSGLLDSQDIDARIAARTEAKTRRDFAEADRIRDELAGEGVVLEDGPSGTTWRRA